MSIIQFLFSTKGRIDRQSWWLVTILLVFSNIIIDIIYNFLIGSYFGKEIELNEIAFLIIFIFYIGILISYMLLLLSWIIITIKRLHDLNHSGWTILLFLVPIVNLVLPLLLAFQKGTEGPNQYNIEKQMFSQKQQLTKQCPFCAEDIKYQAIVCRYCGRDLPKQKEIEVVNVPKIENEEALVQTNNKTIITSTINPKLGKFIKYVVIPISIIITILACIIIYDPFKPERCILSNTTNLYSGPSILYASVGSVVKGSCFRFGSRSENYLWVRITGISEYRGYWIRARDVNIKQEEIITLPISR